MSQVYSQEKTPAAPRRRWGAGIAAIGVIAAVSVLTPYWLPEVQRWSGSTGSPSTETESAHDDHGHGGDAHEGHDHEGHDHEGHSEANALEMSEQARKNIGLRVAKLELAPFTRTVNVPGMIAERPGRSSVLVTAPMTGIITRIHIIEGEAIEPGHKLFDLRLTHEELVQSQAELLQTAEELDVTDREIKRIERLTENGGLAGKQLLERQYERQKLEAVLRSRKEALLLHGLTPLQVQTILEKRQLLKELCVVAPPWADESSVDSAAKESPSSSRNTPYQVQALKAAPGQHVNAGDALITLADHATLYLQGEAFERDIGAISRAADGGALVSATWESEEGRTEVITGLHILYLATKVDPGTRTLDFFVTLPNQMQRDTTMPDGHRFFAWKFRPGQRVQLQVPIETLPDRLVVPVEAVALDGVESYVFTLNGDHFDRRPVHVEYRDLRQAVIAHDGSVFPGETIAISSAQQLQLALKNKAGGAIDPHAGHNH